MTPTLRVSLHSVSETPTNPGSEQVELLDEPGRSRIEIHAEGQLAGFADYRRDANGLAIVHTEVDPHFGGRGFGAKLVTYALTLARDEDLAVLPFCPFARDFISQNREYLDLVPIDQRDRFGLPTNI